MKLVTSLSLQLSSPLVVIVVEDGMGTLIAYGIDPSQDLNSEDFVFILEIRNSDLGAFLKAVVDGNGNLGKLEPYSIVVPVKPPVPPWPQAPVVIALARSVSTDQQLAQLSTGAVA